MQCRDRVKMDSHSLVIRVPFQIAKSGLSPKQPSLALWVNHAAPLVSSTHQDDMVSGNFHALPLA